MYTFTFFKKKTLKIGSTIPHTNNDNKKPLYTKMINKITNCLQE